MPIRWSTSRIQGKKWILSKAKQKCNGWCHLVIFWPTFCRDCNLNDFNYFFRYLEECAAMSRRLIQLFGEQQIIDIQWKKYYSDLMLAENRWVFICKDRTDKNESRTVLKRNERIILWWLLPSLSPVWIVLSFQSYQVRQLAPISIRQDERCPQASVHRNQEEVTWVAGTEGYVLSRDSDSVRSVHGH